MRDPLLPGGRGERLGPAPQAGGKRPRLSFAASRLALLAAAALLAAQPRPAPAAAEKSPAQTLEAAVVSVYKQRADAVARVKVATKNSGGEGEGEPQTALTVFSGFFVSADGKVVTNAIEPEGDGRIWIEKDGLSYLADLVGSDERANLSLLQVVNLPESFGHVALEGPPARPAIGSLAISIASPLDFPPTPAFGLVAGFESHFASYVFPFTYTRVSIPLGPAEGGSPVFDAQGRLLGVSMASMPEARSSYLVPAKALRRIVADLKEAGRTRYGELPIAFEEKADPFKLGKRVQVASVEPGSPAERAGARVGDLLQAIDGEPMSSIEEVRDAIFYKRPDNFMLFKLKRGDRILEFALLIQPRQEPAEASEQPSSPRLEGKSRDSPKEPEQP